MKRTGILFIILFVNVFAAFTQNYILKYDVQFYFSSSSSYRYYIQDAEYSTFGGRTVSITENFGFTRLRENKRLAGNIRIPVSYGFIKQIRFKTARQIQRCFGFCDWFSDCNDYMTVFQTASSATTCFNLSGQQLSWQCLSPAQTPNLITFQCYPELSISSAKTTMTNDEKFVVQATAGFPSQVYKWIYSTDAYRANWSSVPSSCFNNDRFEASSIDLFGEEGALNMIGKTFSLRIDLGCGIYTDPINIDVKQTCPGIESIDIENVNCPGESSGAMILHLDRDIYPNENVEIAAYTKDDITGKQVAFTTIDSKTLRIDNLYKGSYTVRIVSTYYNSNDNRNYSFASKENSLWTNVIIGEPDPVVFNTEQKQDIECYGESTGSFKIAITGGTPDYKIFWRLKDTSAFNEAEGREVTNLPAGIYEYYAIDANGCEQRDNEGFLILNEVKISEPEQLILTCPEDRFVTPSGSGMSNGSIIVQVKGGKPNYTVVWKNESGEIMTSVQNSVQNGIFESVLNNIPAGDYSVTVTDANNCSKSIDLITLDEPFAIKGNLIQTGYINCNGDANASLEITSVEGGVPGTSGNPYNFRWYKCLTATDSVYLGNQTSISNLGPGKYVVTVTDLSDPPNMKNFYYTITEPDPVLASLTSVNVSCYNGNNGAITVSVSGGTAPYKLFYREGSDSYSNVSFTNLQYTLNNLQAGRYNLYVTDAGNCPAKVDGSDVATVIITQPANDFIIVSQRVKNTSAAGRSDGLITIKIDGGIPLASAPQYRVIWRSNSGIITANDFIDTDNYFTSTISDLPKGTYTVQISGGTNPGSSGPCILNMEYELDEPKPLAVNWQITPISCFGRNDGVINAIVSGGVQNEELNEAPYLYEWYRIEDGNPVIISGENKQTLANIGKGLYRIKITDFSDPPNIKEFDCELKEPDAVAVTVSTTPVSCFMGDNGSFKVNVTGGTSPYRLFYKPVAKDDYSELTAANGNFTVANLISGRYSIYVKDKNDCPVLINNNQVDTVNITQPARALAIASQTVRPPSGEGRADGYITLTINGGTPYTSGTMYNVVWRDENGNPIEAKNSNLGNGMFSSSIVDLPKGLYSVEIKDSLYYGRTGACYLYYSFTIEEPGPITVELENTKTVDCFGEKTGELVAFVSGGLPFMSGMPYIYKWYKIEITGINEDEDEAIIEATYLENQTDSILSGVGAGLYIVLIEDSCTPPNVSADIPFFEITEPSLLTTKLTTKDISCFGGRNGKIEISVSGGVGNYVMHALRKNVDKDYYEVPWDEGNGRFIMDSLYSGIYEVYIQDANLCYAKINGNDIATITLKQPNQALTIDSVLQINPSKFGGSNGSIEILISGGTPYPDGVYTVVWKNNHGTVLTGAHRIEAGKFISTTKDLPEGSYYVEIRDANYYETGDKISNEACIATDNFTLTQPEPFEGELKETYISCFGQSDGEIMAFAWGGVVNPDKNGLPYIYQWYQQNDAGDYILLPGKNESKLTNLRGGYFMVEITDYSWLPNVLTMTYHLVEPEPLIASASSIEILCGESANISVEVSGGTVPYSYQWSTGAQTVGLNGVYPGIYMVFVTDSHGCSVIATARVTSPGDVRATGVTSDPVCHDGNDGKIILTVSGGTAPYTYQWSDGSRNRDLTGAKAGFYTVNVFDRDGCACSESFELKNPEPVKLDLGEDQILCVGQTYTPNPVYDDPASTFRWTSDNGFSSTDKTVVLDRAGTYRLTITDSKGCQATDEMTIVTKDYNISCEMVVATSTAVNDTIILVNISYPDPDRIEWMFSPDDPVVILKTSSEIAEVVFTQEGEYNVGMRSFVSDCFQDVVKTISVTKSGAPKTDDFGSADIKKFIAYPNPNKGVFKVDVELESASGIRLRLISLAQGVLLSNKTWSGSNKYSIDYSEVLTAGAYILLLETPASQRSIKLIIY